MGTEEGGARSGEVIAAWIRRQLARHDWTAADLSRRLGVGSGRISEWISGKRVPNPESCLKLAEAFGADPDEVLALAGHRLPTRPLRPDDPKARIIALVKRVPMSPQQAAGLEAMLRAWLEAGPNGGAGDDRSPRANGS